MLRLGELMADHPAAVGVICAAALVLPAFQIYRVGMTMGSVRAIRAEAAYAASEALGG